MTAYPQTVEEEGRIYSLALPQYLDQVAGAEIVATTGRRTIAGLGRNLVLVDAEERAKLGLVAPGLLDADYTPAETRLIRIPNGTVYNYSRTDGMAVTADGNFVRDTYGSPRILAGNRLVRTIDNKAWYFDKASPPSGTLERAFLGFDPATPNYAHFLGVFLPRIIFADKLLTDHPFLFPDLPDFTTHHPGSMRNEFFYRLSEIYPLSNGNYYHPVAPGKILVKNLVISQSLPPRWDLPFYSEVSAAFDTIGIEAIRRYKLRNDAPLPERLFISRQEADHRRFTNNAEIVAALVAEGFAIMQLEKLDFWDQVAYFAAARIVVGPHGAGLANILFNPGTATLVEIHPDPLPMQLFAHGSITKKCRFAPFACTPLNAKEDMKPDIEGLLHKIRQL